MCPSSTLPQYMFGGGGVEIGIDIAKIPSKMSAPLIISWLLIIPCTPWKTFSYDKFACSYTIYKCCLRSKECRSRKMLLRNVRTLTVNLCDLVKGSRSICCLNATKNLKKFDVCVLSSYNANFQTRRHSFINTFSYDKLFRRRFALTASHSCKRHDEIERDSEDKRAVCFDIIY